MKKSILVLVALLGSLPAWSQGKDAVIAKVLDVSGIQFQMEAVPQMMEEMLAAQSEAFGSERASRVAELMIQAFSSVQFLSHQTLELAENYDERLCGLILQAYSTTALQRATKAENDNGYVSDEELAAFHGVVSAEREAILASLIDATHSVEVTTELSAGALHSLLATMNLFLPAQRKISPATEQVIIEQTTKPLRSAAYFESLKKRYALIYQGLSNEELNLYIEFYLSPEGRYLHERYIAGLNRAFVNCMRRAAGDITKEFGLSDSQA